MAVFYLFVFYVLIFFDFGRVRLKSGHCDNVRLLGLIGFISFLQGQLSHVVHYVTTLELDADVLEGEVQPMNQELVTLFPGFCHEIDNVAYAAYTEPPLDPEQNYPSVGVVASCPDQ